MRVSKVREVVKKEFMKECVSDRNEIANRLFRGDDSIHSKIKEKDDELLFIAARFGCPKSTKKLLKLGSDVNHLAVNYAFSSPLHGLLF